MKPSTRDDAVTSGITKSFRRLNRRKFLGGSASAVAGGLATVLLGFDARLATAAGPCYPPHGRYCSGCRSDAGCPSGYVTCTNAYLPQAGGYCPKCPYSSGWWYSSCSGGTKYKCRDCILSVGPVSCGPSGFGVCGCRSTFSC